MDKLPEISDIYFSPRDDVSEFWDRFGEIERELRYLIDSGDSYAATAEITTLLHSTELDEYVFPSVSRYCYRNSMGISVVRYILMLTGGGVPCAEQIAAYIVSLCKTDRFKDWDVYPYAVRGFYTQLPATTGVNPEFDPPLIQAIYVEGQDVFQVRLFVYWNPEDFSKDELAFMGVNPAVTGDIPLDEFIPTNVFCANYMYLCQIIGEDRLRGATLEIVPFPKTEMVFEGDCISVQEFSELIDRQIKDKNKLKFPLCNLRNVEMEGTAEERRVSLLTSSCEQLSFDLILGSTGIAEYILDGGFGIGTLFFPIDRASSDDIPIISGILSQHIERTHCAQSVDFCSGPDGFYLDMIVADRDDMKDVIETLRPLLDKFGGKFSLRENHPDSH